MKIRSFLGLSAIAFTVLASTHVTAAPRATQTRDVRVGGVSIEHGKVKAALLSGADQGILPGDKGFFIKDGQKVPGSDFEVQKVGDRVAWTVTGFATVDEMRFRTSLSTRVTSPTRTCSNKGRKLALVVSTAKESDDSFTFTIDKGTADGVMPSSRAETTGSYGARGGKADITWVSANSAGGIVRNVSKPEEAGLALHEMLYDTIVCK